MLFLVFFNMYCTVQYFYTSAFFLASTVRRRLDTSVKLPMLNWAPVAVVNEKSVFKVCKKKHYQCILLRVMCKISTIMTQLIDNLLCIRRVVILNSSQVAAL